MKKMEYSSMKSQNNYDVIVAVDVGLHGGVAFFDTVSGELLSLYPMPTMEVTSKSGKVKNKLDLERLKFILEIPREHNESAVVVMEDVHAFPGQGSVSMATLLEQKGILRGLAKGLGYAEYLVEPKTWQKYFDLIPPKDLKGSNASKTKTLRKKWLKDRSLQTARALYSEWAETKLAPKDAHGLSDACLIGRWFLNGKTN
jgi:hypothetical protein